MYFQHHPTAWTLSHIIPAHTKDMKGKYGMGLGLNSMEGREAKHIFIARYNFNTNYQSRWEQFFRHAFISLVWLRERGCNISKDNSSSLSYIPKRASQNHKYCYCGFHKAPRASKCNYCLHPLRVSISTSLRTGEAFNKGWWMVASLTYIELYMYLALVMSGSSLWGSTLRVSRLAYIRLGKSTSFLSLYISLHYIIIHLTSSINVLITLINN